MGACKEIVEGLILSMGCIALEAEEEFETCNEPNTDVEMVTIGDEEVLYAVYPEMDGWWTNGVCFGTNVSTEQIYYSK